VALVAADVRVLRTTSQEIRGRKARLPMTAAMATKRTGCLFVSTAAAGNEWVRLKYDPLAAKHCIYDLWAHFTVAYALGNTQAIDFRFGMEITMYIARR
jgi:coenzyme PQQ precursor peptide PqqA